MTIPDTLTAAAHIVEDDEHFRSAERWKRPTGPTIFSVLHYTAQALTAAPAIVHLEKHLNLKHLQHWQETDPAIIAATLRAAAGVTPDTDTELVAARRQLNVFRSTIADALGWDGIAEATGPHLFAQQIAERMNRFEARATALAEGLRAIETLAAAAAIIGDAAYNADTLVEIRRCIRQLAP